MLRGINRWLEANRWAGDAAIVSGLLLASLLAHSSSDRVGLVMSAALILPLYARRSAPRSVLVAVTLLCVLQLLVLPVPVFGDVAAPLAVHAVSAHVRDRRWGIGALAAGLVGALLGAVQWAGGRVGQEQFVLLFGAAAASVAAAYLLGARQRDQRERVQEQFATLQERNRLLAVERDQRAEVVAAAERARIARELHDIVAHSLSVIVVQASGAAAAVTAAPNSAAELAPRVLDTIADTQSRCAHRDAPNGRRAAFGQRRQRSFRRDRDRPGLRPGTRYRRPPCVGGAGQLGRDPGDARAARS